MLNYRVIGNNPDKDWLVLVHGAGGSISSWFRQVQDFSRHFNLLLVDMAGHGESQDATMMQDASFEKMAEQIVEVIDHLKIEKCHFLALSIGCVVVQVIAKHHPSRIKKMVLAGAITTLNLKARLIIRITNRLKHILPYSAIKWMLVNIIIPQKGTRKIYSESVEQLSFASFLTWLGIITKMNRLITSIFSYKCCIPTLYLMGEADSLFLSEARRTVKRNKEYTSLIVVPDAGHACNIDNKEFFNSTSINYLLA